MSPSNILLGLINKAIHSAGIIGIVRIIAVWRPSGSVFPNVINIVSADRDLVDIQEDQILVGVQLAVAVYCCCAPTYRTILPSEDISKDDRYHRGAYLEATFHRNKDQRAQEL